MDLSKQLYKGMEALVLLAIERTGLTLSCSWNPDHHVVPLSPDIVIGEHLYAPAAVISVTHQGAQNAGQMKSWRDLHELFLYRTTSPATRIVRVIYGEAPSRRWAQTQGRFYDAFLELNTLPGYSLMAKEIQDLTRKHYHRMERAEVKRHLELQCSQAPLLPFITALSAFFKGFLVTKAPPQSFSVPPEGVTAAPLYPTSLKRGVTLCGLFPELLTLRCGPRITQKLLASGVLEESLSGLRAAAPYDAWLDSARHLLGDQRLTSLARKASVWLKTVRRRWYNMERFLDAVEQASAVTPGSMSTLLSHPGAAAVGGVPLLLGLRYLFKSVGKDSFGHALLLKEADLPQDTASLYAVSKMFRGELPLHPGLREPLLNRVPRAHELLRDHADTLYARIFSVLFKDEAIKVRQIEPLLWLIEEGGPRNATLRSRFPTAVDPTGRSATVRVLTSGSSLAHWKTAHMGERDKTKELAAKGYALYLQHPEITKRYLFIDGSWSPKNVEILVKSGWTHVIGVSSLREVFSKKRFTKGSLWV